MAPMNSLFDLSTTAKRFRFVAVAEAITWLGLLIGMGFKYLGPHNEIGVKIFGPIHGVVFLAFVVIAAVTARRLSWTPATTVSALASSIPPFGTVLFELWAERTGRLTVADDVAQPAAVAS